MKIDSAEIATVRAFISAINAADIPALADLMTDDHTFVDSAGKIVSGR